MTDFDQSGANPLPTDAPETLRFDGIVEGRTVDADAIKAAARDLRRASGQRFDVEFDGPSFSILGEGVVRSGDSFDEPSRVDFLDALRGVTAAAEPGSVESTLRCTAWFGGQVAETVFGIEDGEPRPIGRMRPRGPNEGRTAADGPAFRFDRLGRSRTLAIVALMLVAVGIHAWRDGIFQRAFAEDAQHLEIDAGALAGLVSMTAESEWSWSRFGFSYEVKIRATEAFPRSPQELESAVESAESLVARAAMERLQSGGEFEVKLLDERGEVLRHEHTHLVVLLQDADATVEVDLEGHLDGHRIELGLESDR